MKKPSDSRRKSPKQERSKALVDSIFEATVRILPIVGSAGVTTKKIADFAGVSIGSLYQYFPNKESLLSGLIDQFASMRTSSFAEKIKAMNDQSIDDATDTMIDMALDLFLTEKEKVREVFRLAPELGRLPTLLKLRQSIVEKLAERMAVHRPGHPPEFYVRTCFMAVNSVMGVIQTMLYDDTQTYSTDELALELKAMVRAYFKEVT